VREEIESVAGGAAGVVVGRLAAAASAYEADRYSEAAAALRPLASRYPASPTIRELYGLTLYRQGRWSAAIRELDAYGRLTGSFDQYPVLADCHRALGHHRVVDELWEQLRDASPNGALVAEGRLVAAGSLADRGDLHAAIRLLRRARTGSSRPRPHDVRQWYALGDLYERAGDIPSARELFSRVVRQDAEVSDAAERLAALD
jgi:tetratricopeptide (TPR) repeat protein